MASGSSKRPLPGSSSTSTGGFDFASDDILCSYEDYVHQNENENQNTNSGAPTLSDPANPTQDFQKSRISRSSMFPATNVYSQPEESLNQELLSTVERTMKKYADNLMRFLEGISSRLSQLELYCYNLDKSISEMRTDLVRDHGDADSKLKFLVKHLQEVHRSVQILRDKQELAETQKELAKLHFTQKDSSSTQEDGAVVSAPESKKSDDGPDTHNTQLALALPNQITTQPSQPSQQSSTAPPQPLPQAISQLPPYYLPNPHNHSQPSYLPVDPQYRVPQSSQPQMNPQQYPQYQQQWSQQVSQPMPPPQQPSMLPPQKSPMQPPQQSPNQIRAQTPQSQVYPSYVTTQPSNLPPEPMQVPFPGSQLSGGSRPEAMPYGYGGPARPVQPQPQPPPQQMKGGFPAHQGDGYATGGAHPPMSSGGTYMLYDSEGGRPLHASQQTHYPQSGYPPVNPSPPNMPPPSNNSLMIRSPSPQQYVRSHPYNELIDKLVSMGYRGDQVMSVIQRLEESGQAVDFNALLDRLNGHSSGSSQRSW
ncbi:uncharacterized protein LOC141634045 [Silene latifolia]|uniref:uncharacterized protein LOC141634045 n=1 Tax=Silene latifolia TaxID=37657 RepID=UPI003D7881A8